MNDSFLIDEPYNVLQRPSAGIPQKDHGPNTYSHLQEPATILPNDAYEVCRGRSIEGGNFLQKRVGASTYSGQFVSKFSKCGGRVLPRY